MDVYKETLELIGRVDPFCRDRIGQVVAMDHVIDDVVEMPDLTFFVDQEVEALITNKVVG